MAIWVALRSKQAIQAEASCMWGRFDILFAECQNNNLLPTRQSVAARIGRSTAAGTRTAA
jgi:hypothetical protein